jgi:hypothetical protein
MKQTSTLVKTSNEPNLLKLHGTGWHSVVHMRSRASAPPMLAVCIGAMFCPIELESGEIGYNSSTEARTLRTQSASICPRLSRLIATSAETMSSQEHLAQCLGPVVRCGRLHAVRTRKRPNDCTVRAHDLRRKGRRSERKVRHSFKRSTGFCGSDPSMAFSIVFRSDTTNLNRTPLSQPVVRFF